MFFNGVNCSNSTRRTRNAVKSASFFLAAYMCVPSINAVIGNIMGDIMGLGVMTFLYISLAMILLIHTALFAINNGHKVRIKIVPIFLTIFFFFSLTCLGSATRSVGFTEFVIYVFLPIMFAQFLIIDAAYFLKWCAILPAFGIFFLSDIFVIDPVFNYIEMGVCYAFLTPILCNIAFLFCCFKQEKLIWKSLMLIVSLCNFTFLLKLVYFGSRGPLLSIVICVAFFFMFTVKENKCGLHISGIKTVLIIILGCYIAFNFWQILDDINSYLIKNDINIKFVEKMLRLYEQGDVLNGRNLDYEAAIAGIKDNPIFGNGLATFEYYTGYVYPHNLILQLLYDGGIVLFLLILIPVILNLIKWIRCCSRPSFVFMTTLLVASVPGAMFSGDVWTKPILWYAFALLCVYSSNKNQKLLCV